MTRGSDVRVHRGRLSPGLGIRGTCLGGEVTGVLAHRLAERERLSVVICEEFGLVVALPRQSLDPLGGGQMFGSPVAAANLRVRDVFGHGMAELELDFTLNRRAPYALQQL